MSTAVNIITYLVWFICTLNRSVPTLSTGGVTTVVDMPLNNYPTTVSKEKLKLKVLVIDSVCAFK